MKYIILSLTLFCVGAIQAQSKKEMRATIEALRKDSALLYTTVRWQDSVIRSQETLLQNKKRELTNLRNIQEQKTLEFQKEIKNLEIEVETLKSELAKVPKQGKEVAAQKDNTSSKSNTVKSIKTDKTNSPNTSSSPNKNDNPFGSGGGSGKGPLVNDKGMGTGTGPSGIGNGSERVRLTDPMVNDISSEQNHVIYLRAKINAEGRIVEVINLVSKTTTADEIILNKVIDAVKNQVQYNKKEGAGLEFVYLTINLNAN